MRSTKVHRERGESEAADEQLKTGPPEIHHDVNDGNGRVRPYQHGQFPAIPPC